MSGLRDDNWRELNTAQQLERLTHMTLDECYEVMCWEVNKCNSWQLNVKVTLMKTLLIAVMRGSLRASERRVKSEAMVKGMLEKIPLHYRQAAREARSHHYVPNLDVTEITHATKEWTEPEEPPEGREHESGVYTQDPQSVPHPYRRARSFDEPKTPSAWFPQEPPPIEEEHSQLWRKK